MWKYCLLILVLIVGSTQSVLAESDEFRQVGKSQTITPENMVLDAVLIRPLGVATTVVGTAVFVIGLPFSAIAGNVNESAKNLIVKPGKYTFNRKLGDI